MRQEKRCSLTCSFPLTGLFLFVMAGSLCSAHDMQDSDASLSSPVDSEKKKSEPRVHALTFFLVAAVEQALQQSQSQKMPLIVSGNPSAPDTSQPVMPTMPGAVPAYQSAVSRVAGIIRSFFGSAIAVGRFLHTVFLKK